MGFFKDFKEDLSEAVEEMIPTGKENSADEDVINTITDNVDVSGTLGKLDELLESASTKMTEDRPVKESTISSSLNDITPRPAARPEVNSAIPSFHQTPASDENSVITPGMTVTGDLDTSGSIEVEGRVNGNIRCNGKLTVTGIITGNSVASEVFADAARIDGEINASGTVKVGAGSVVIGNITATSAVIAGAVKGDIDVQGPVVVDTSAVVMGNVKSRSVQINNGAVIEGFCSQAYAETDVSAVFSN